VPITQENNMSIFVIVLMLAVSFGIELQPPLTDQLVDGALDRSRRRIRAG